MKKILPIILITVIMLSSAYELTYAEVSKDNSIEDINWIISENESVDTENYNSNNVNNQITNSDISRGLSFCREYPVTVQIGGIDVPTSEKEVPPVIVASRTLIPARAFFESMGAEVSWDGEKRAVKVTSDDTTVELVIDSSVTSVDGKEVILEVPAMIIDHDEDGNGSTMLPLRFVSEGLGYDVAWEDSTRTANVTKPIIAEVGEDTTTFETTWGAINVLNDNASEKLIVVDIGHGGKDTGCIGNEDLPDELYEKDINLEIGLKLKTLLEEAGAKYIFTRETDTYMQLYDRPAFANGVGGDVFVSIHNNSSDYSKPEGTEVYYYSKVNEEEQDEGMLYGIYSKDIAKLVQNELVKILGTTDRGAKESPKLAVLNKTSMPAIVVEGAFMSNPEDQEKMRTKEYKEQYAYAVAKGLIAAMNKVF